MVAFAASLPAQTPQYYNLNTGTSSNSFPFNVAGGKAVNSLFLAGEFNQPTPIPPGQQITKVYFRMSTATSRTFTNLHILMAQSTITTLTSGQFYPGPWDTVYFNPSATLSATAGGWMQVTLNTPFPYEPTKSLILFVGQCGATGSGGSVYNSSLSGIRRTWSVGGCPFVPFASGDASMLNFGVDVVPVIPTNRALLLPTPGVNTNYVMIPHQAGMIGFTNITIEAWVRIGGSTTPNTVLNKGGSSFDYQLGINGTTTNPFFRAISTIVIANTVTVTPNVWTHLAVTYDGTAVRFYKNGALSFTQTQSLTMGSSTNEMRIGRGGSEPGSGRIDEVRLWNVSKTESEISSEMCNKWIANSSAGLKGKWHFDSSYTDSVSGWNGTPLGNVGFDTVTWCPITGMQKPGTEVPERFELSQNYPNPFNPSTTIDFSLPKAGYVEVILYDVTGRQVAALVSDPFKAGTYSLTFDGSKLSSGVYFYKITAGDFTDTKKMVLVK